MKDKRMNIQLKQSEIEKALRQFIQNQGINLAGKTLHIAFTSGRKENGLLADLTIEDSGDVQIPGFATGDADKADTALTGEVNPVATKSEAGSVTVNDAPTVDADAPAAAPAAEVKAVVAEVAVDPAPVGEVVEVPAEAKAPVSSLFGS